jgi:glycosyltransferase involved in cell wall biosynthesis
VRIAIVGTELCAVDAKGGGLEQVLRRWARALAADHEIVVISHQPGGRPPVTSADEPYETVTVVDTAELGAVVRRVGAGVVSLHNRPQWAESCGSGPAVRVTFHNYPVAWRASKSELVAARHVRASAVSHALARAAEAELGGDLVAVVPPSIDPIFCEPMSPHPQRTVLSPNRLLRKKGVVELLEVARHPELADVTFLFADLISPWLRPTKEHFALRAAVRAQANAELFAPTNNPAALAERYRAAGVVASAVQEAEGLGLVALEAQACGSALVTTDLGGLREATFAPNVCIAAGDPDALAHALIDALERTTAAEEARDNVVARHAPESSARAFEGWLLG